MPWRVLYVENTHTVGGSLVSLYYLVRGLDRTRFQPVVLLPPANPWLDRFRALDCEVIATEPYRLAPRSPIAQGIRASRATRGLKRFTWSRRLYHQAGFALKLVRGIWPSAKRLQRLILDRDIDCVHTNWFVAHDRPAILAGRLAGVPCVSHIRAFETLNSFDRLVTVRCVDEFVFISRALERDHLGQRSHIPRGSVVYNGLDLSGFSSSANPGQVREELGLAAADKVVGMVGRVEPWKGQAYFIRAMLQATRRFPDLKALVVGQVEPHARVYYEELLQLVEELGLSDKVVFTGFRSDLPRLLRGLDLLVHSSVDPEPFGRVIIEGMAAGVPVIGMDAGAVPEIIEDGVSGVLVPPGDVEALANTVCSLLASPDRSRRLAQEARRRVEERFTVEQYVAGVQRVYEGLVGAG